MEEKTKDYIRIENSFIRLFVIALILVFLAGSLWGITGDIPISQTVKGYIYRIDADISEDGTDSWATLCFMDASRYNGILLEGNSATIRMVDGTVTQSSIAASTELPTTPEDVSSIYQIPHWMLSDLAPGDYVYIVSIRLDSAYQEYEGQMVDVTIVVDHKKPFELL